MTVKVNWAEGPLLGKGLLTETRKEPGSVIAEAGMTAVSCVGLTNVVVKAFPKKVCELTNWTPAPLKKLDPVRVRVTLGSPDLALVGEIKE